MGFFVTLNFMGIRLLSRTNSAITIFKLAIPSLVAVALIMTGFHFHNFSAAGGFFVHGGAGPTQAILSAITAGGIAFASWASRGRWRWAARAPTRSGTSRGPCSAPSSSARRSTSPSRSPSSAPSRPRSCRTLELDGARQRPATLEGALLCPGQPVGLVWLAWIMRVDAVVSPGGTGLLYLTGASRLSFGLSRDGYVPKLFLVEDERTDVPLWGVIMSGALGLLFLLPFPSWNKLVSVVTGAVVLMYAGAPLALGSLRRSRPELARPYRLRRPACSPRCPSSSPPVWPTGRVGRRSRR